MGLETFERGFGLWTERGDVDSVQMTLDRCEVSAVSDQGRWEGCSKL